MLYVHNKLLQVVTQRVVNNGRGEIVTRSQIDCLGLLIVVIIVYLVTTTSLY